jgi:hypothetical protein
MSVLPEALLVSHGWEVKLRGARANQELLMEQLRSMT